MRIMIVDDILSIDFALKVSSASKDVFETHPTTKKTKILPDQILKYQLIV